MKNLRSVLLRAIDKFERKNILVIGDTFLDKFTFGTSRENPEKSATPLITATKHEYILGGAGNVARNIVSLGANCSLYGIIGKDFHGKKLINLCQEIGIDWRGKRTTIPTIIKQRIYEIEDEHYIMRLDDNEPSKIIKDADEKQLEIWGNELLGAKKSIIKHLEKNREDADYAILSDYNKYIFTNPFTDSSDDFAGKVIEILKYKGGNVPVLIDPSPKNFLRYSNCTIITPNRKEAQDMIKMFPSVRASSLEEMAKYIGERLDSDYIAITCGKEGAYIYENKKETGKHISTKEEKASDVIGAGDTFGVAVALGQASGLEFENAVILANCASSVVVRKQGTATTSAEELREEVRRRY